VSGCVNGAKRARCRPVKFFGNTRGFRRLLGNAWFQTIRSAFCRTNRLHILGANDILGKSPEFEGRVKTRVRRKAFAVVSLVW